MRHRISLIFLVCFVTFSALPAHAEGAYTVPGEFRFQHPEQWSIVEHSLSAESIAWDAVFTDEEAGLRLVVYVEAVPGAKGSAVDSLYSADEETIDAYKNFILELQRQNTRTVYLQTYTIEASGVRVPFIITTYWGKRGSTHYASTMHDGCEIAFLLYRTSGETVTDDDLQILLDTLATFEPIAA